MFDNQICAVATEKMALKGALVKVGFCQEEINNNKHRHAVDRAKRRLLSLHGTSVARSLPVLLNIVSPSSALSTITNTDTTTATTTTKNKRKKRLS